MDDDRRRLERSAQADDDNPEARARLAAEERRVGHFAMRCLLCGSSMRPSNYKNRMPCVNCGPTLIDAQDEVGSYTIVWWRCSRCPWATRGVAPEEEYSESGEGEGSPQQGSAYDTYPPRQCDEVCLGQEVGDLPGTMVCLLPWGHEDSTEHHHFFARGAVDLNDGQASYNVYTVREDHINPRDPQMVALGVKLDGTGESFGVHQPDVLASLIKGALDNGYLLERGGFNFLTGGPGTSFRRRGS